MIMAAGGILERATSKGAEIALVYSSTDGPEWSLPKGKAKDGEELSDTALREVEEQTGYTADLMEIAGTIHYTVEGVPKLVLFWRMKPGAKGEMSSSEVEKVAWVSPEAAIKRLTYRKEKDFIRLTFPRQTLGARLDFFRWIKALFRMAGGLRRFRRLEGSIQCYRIESRQRILISDADHGQDGNWAENLQLLLDAAEANLLRYNIDAAWKCFNGAQRMELYGLDAHGLGARIIELRKEASKVKRWRAEAMERLLEEKGGKLPPVDYIYRAALLRDEHFSNRAYIQGIVRRHMFNLASLLLLLIATFALLEKEGKIPFGVINDADPVALILVAVALFGLFGGVISAALKVPSSTNDANVPETVASGWVTILRMATGAGSAVIVYIALKSGLAGFFNIPAENMSYYTIYTISFVAGFSERLVLRVVGEFAGK